MKVPGTGPIWTRDEGNIVWRYLIWGNNGGVVTSMFVVYTFTLIIGLALFSTQGQAGIPRPASRVVCALMNEVGRMGGSSDTVVPRQQIVCNCLVHVATMSMITRETVEAKVGD